MKQPSNSFVYSPSHTDVSVGAYILNMVITTGVVNGTHSLYLKRNDNPTINLPATFRLPCFRPPSHQNATITEADCLSLIFIKNRVRALRRTLE